MRTAGDSQELPNASGKTPVPVRKIIEIGGHLALVKEGAMEDRRKGMVAMKIHGILTTQRTNDAVTDLAVRASKEIDPLIAPDDKMIATLPGITKPNEEMETIVQKILAIDHAAHESVRVAPEMTVKNVPTKRVSVTIMAIEGNRTVGCMICMRHTIHSVMSIVASEDRTVTRWMTILCNLVVCSEK